MSEIFIAFSSNNYFMVLLEAAQLLHLVGIAWGVGGATIAAMVMMKAEKNPEAAPHIMKVMPGSS